MIMRHNASAIHKLYNQTERNLRIAEEEKKRYDIRELMIITRPIASFTGMTAKLIYRKNEFNLLTSSNAPHAIAIFVSNCTENGRLQRREHTMCHTNIDGFQLKNIAGRGHFCMSRWYQTYEIFFKMYKPENVAKKQTRGHKFVTIPTCKMPNNVIIVLSEN